LTIVAYNFAILFSGTAIAETIAVFYILVPLSFLSGLFLVFKRKAIFALLLVLIIFAFFSSNLLTDDSPYFAKYSYPSVGEIMYANQQSFSLVKFILYMNPPAKILGTIVSIISPYYFNGTLSASIAYNNLLLNMNTSNSYIAVSTYTGERWANGISPSFFSNYLNFLIYKSNNDILFNNGDSYLIRI